ncbi:MAG: type II toxin-antitoxin system VapC family toxin [Firmicutes bacterium]|nr:type II toxin-antitoxin system VapC family toxin [Bacillota bacterium]
MLDAAVALAWCFPDESNAYADAVLHRFRDETAVVPAIWPLEVANALVVGVRRSRLTSEQLAHASRLLQALPIDVDTSLLSRVFDGTVRLATSHGLSVYDVAYLELAQRLQCPLATADTRLATAAKVCGLFNKTVPFSPLLSFRRNLCPARSRAFCFLRPMLWKG